VMLPFVILGGMLSLYMLRGLCAYPLQVWVQGNSIVYVNQGTNQTWIAVLYIIATCGSLFAVECQEVVLIGT
jgi:hypothetical protein